MPRLRILYDTDGWAYHNKARALQKYAPSDFEVSLAVYGPKDDVSIALGDGPLDIVFAQPFNRIRTVRNELQRRGCAAKLVATWTEGWPERLSLFGELNEEADVIVVANQECWERLGRLPNTCMIANGVDLEVFHVRRPLEQRAPKVLWMGSMLARDQKGYDEFLLPLRNRLEALRIECDFRLVDSFGRNKLSPAEMAAWYNSGTVLVCASRAEGTPNTALEAAACGCTVVSTPVGNMPQLIRNGVNGYLVERNQAALLRGVQAACANYVELATNMRRSIRSWHWKNRCREFFRLFREVLHSGADPQGGE